VGPIGSTRTRIDRLKAGLTATLPDAPPAAKHPGRRGTRRLAGDCQTPRGRHSRISDSIKTVFIPADYTCHSRGDVADAIQAVARHPVDAIGYPINAALRLNRWNADEARLNNDDRGRAFNRSDIGVPGEVC
jgi:hypothetical protein